MPEHQTNNIDRLDPQSKMYPRPSQGLVKSHARRRTHHSIDLQCHVTLAYNWTGGSVNLPPNIGLTILLVPPAAFNDDGIVLGFENVHIEGASVCNQTVAAMGHNAISTNTRPKVG